MCLIIKRLSDSTILKYLIIVFFLNIGNLHAQDLLVTTANDSLNCKILNQGDSIKYSSYFGGVKKENTISANLIKAVIPNFYATSIKQFEDSLNFIKAHRTYKQLRNDEFYFSDKKFRISMNALYSKRLPFQKDYEIYNFSSFNDDLVYKSMYQYGGNIEIAVALNADRTSYINFQVERSQNNITIENASFTIKNLNIYNGTALIQNTYTSYSICYLDAFKLKKPYHVCYFSIGLSYNQLYNDIRLPNYNIVVSGQNLGAIIGAMYDNRITKNWALGVGSFLNLGYITSIKVTENGYDKKPFETIGKLYGTSRFFFSLGLKYYL